MTLRLITAPASATVATATAKAFLRIDHTSDDTLIETLVKAASEKGEALARRAFITQTLEQTFDEWPSDYLLTVLRPRLQSVTSVKYLDENADEFTWTDYAVDAKSEPGKIIFNSFPSVDLLDSGGITVRFVAGYGASESAIPERIKQAVLQLVAYWYEARGAGFDVPKPIREMFTAERAVWF
ncbi:MAG: phage head-tail connector protein [Chloroflexi bacterium]|nr:phage head-tail connector protein [Chloroflexota bacterium]